ncbi:MAG: exodeoxyribonuclease VII small subunit [Candidatus Latescibacteria bacterium]|jgi:exodeoxyribonuclease VII small subunit|nr:exodeoxyribonuclease VII small subunit [Candidatus Latescibacterota bacterium]MBT4137505.1 exodeoxyribonuclease VII small subunit [Candidatus Latescibacterota bacterium]MBT5829397.1 exodeoxyribonuclease VII small subunit [Candidatus Latescibacterota bacterium]
MTKKKTDEPTFEAALQSLEQSVDRLEEGNLPLSDALLAFEEGLKASNVCRALLDDARQRVEVLVEKNGGEFELEALDIEDEDV